MFKRIFQTFKLSIFPSKCLSCGQFFHPLKDNKPEKQAFDHHLHGSTEATFYRVMAPFLCTSCITDFSPISDPFCTRCGRKFESKTITSHQCGDCIQKKPVCSMIRSVGTYKGSLKSAIHGLKYKNKIQLARPLGRLLFLSFLKYYDTIMVDQIIPIPLHATRFRQRGFNQAFLLIREWPDLFAEVRPDLSAKINFKSLVRKRKTLSQTGLGKDKRQQNVKGAFAVREPSEISGKNILIIDDVYTTGSTCNECAATLIKNGAKTVSVLTLARAD